MHKAIGLITCASVMAVSLYLFSGGDPSRTLSAQTDSTSGNSYDAAARRFMQEARELAAAGKTARARHLAETAAALNVKWTAGEQTPDQFLKSLDSGTAADNANPFAVGSDFDWTPMEAGSPAAAESGRQTDEDLFAAADSAETPAGNGVTSTQLLKKRQAQRLLKEAHSAMDAGDYPLARARALQARQLNAPLSMWDERPEHLIAELDKLQQTRTFLGAETVAASEQPAAPAANVSDSFRQANQLVREARIAMDAGRLSEAQQLARQAEQLGVAFSAWEDSPALVLRDIDRLVTLNEAQNDAFRTVADSAPVNSDAEVARQLLREARGAIQQGRLGLARDKALEAQRLNVAYDFFEDTPAIVLEEVDSVLRGGTQSAPARQEAVAQNDTLSSPDARRLVGQAREALRQNDHETARQLAIQAQQQDSAYALFEDRPSLVLEEAQLMAERQRQRSGNEAFAQHNPVDVTPGAGRQPEAPAPMESQVATVNYNGSGERLGASADFAVIRPESSSADAAFRRGMELYRQGDRPAAKLAFQEAWQNGADLDPRKRRQLQDFLQDLASTRTDVRLVASQQGQNGALDINALPLGGSAEEPDPLADAASRSDVLYDRLQTETMNSVFRAERLKEENPDEALQILDNSLATIESAPLAKESLETLAGYVRRSQTSILAYKESRAPLLEREARNQNIREQIETETKARIRIQQEFADLVNEYNQLMEERRYPEAMLTAQKAKDLMPHSAEAMVLVEKARLQKQIAFNEDVRQRQADGSLADLNAVEDALGSPRGDITYDARRWTDLTERRSRYSDGSGRELTEAEVQIKRSLNEKVSLHFQETPLQEVIRHIAMTHGINITLDTRSIESDGLFVNQPVTIDVDGITLRSALNLLLNQAGGLVHTIENETLTITNKLEQDNRLITRPYNVADLVVPLSLANSGQQNRSLIEGLDNAVSGNSLYQVNDELGVNIGGNGLPRNGRGVDKASNQERDFGALMDLITTVVEPSSWVVDGGQGTVAPDENTLSLVIRQTGPVHDQITDLLSQLRKLQDLQVTVEVRFISVSDNFFERIGVDFDFNVNDNVGDPPGVPAFGSRQLTFGGQAGGQAGGNNQGGDLRGNTNQQGQQGQNNTTTQVLFDPITRVRSPRDDFSGQAVGLQSPGVFTNDFDIQFRQGSFEIGVPDFGGYNPNAGIQVGMAILSDIEAFFFIQAAQGDERANIMFAPKVTLFNGQVATIFDFTTRYLVVGQTPVVGTAAVGFSPIIAPIPDGISLTVIAVISADRRYVRLSLAPQITQLIDVQTFTSVNVGGAGIGGGQGGGIGGQGGGLGGGLGGGIGGGIAGGIGGIAGGQGGGGQRGQQGQQGQQGGAGATGTVQLPTIATISVDTTVSVPDGGTVLLGGIKRLREGRNMAGVPILNKIPYISRLFKNSGVGRETESVMLMVTPRII
ncbi:MAG: hypothetical protein KDA85_06580, partial [Planctomycetaceae bacterium]|nr:hypothetical protein [Planctomycetaceae bacterium]